MTEELLEKIIEYLDNTEEIIKMKNLREKINSNKEYLDLMSEFKKNKEIYIKNDSINIEIIKLRKKIFNITELKEYLKIQNNLRLLSISINNIILSVLD